MKTTQSQNSETRCGFAALLGPPNAGKSSFVNCAMKKTLTVVNRKAQTTRYPLAGILTRGQVQIVLWDLAGVFHPKDASRQKGGDRLMVSSAWKTAFAADLILLMIDAARGITKEAEGIANNLKPRKKQVFALLNKVDLVKKPSLLSLAAEVGDWGLCNRIFMISAKTGDGVEDVLDGVREQMPARPFLFPDDQLSDTPMPVLAAEITRGELLNRLHDEIPYTLAVETVLWKETKNGTRRVEQVIYTAKKSHRRIILGGSVLRDAGSRARLHLEDMTGQKTDLFLRVKHRPQTRQTAPHEQTPAPEERLFPTRVQAKTG